MGDKIMLQLLLQLKKYKIKMFECMQIFFRFFCYYCFLTKELSYIQFEIKVKEPYNISIIRRMSSQQSSFRDMFEYPNEGHDQKNRKYLLKGQRNKRPNHEAGRPQKQTFYKVVQKAKNVALFAQNLKQRIAQNHSLNTHTLKSNQLQYLQNDSQIESKLAYFSHQNKIVVAVQIMFIAIIIVNLWYCTFQIVFGDIGMKKLINPIALLIYVIHIILYQVTQYKNQRSELITDLYQIRQIYMRERFVKDLISVIVLALQLTPLDNRSQQPILFLVLRILSLISYMQLSSTCQKVQHLFSISIQGQTIISFLKLLFKLFIFLHCITLLLNLLVIIENSFGIYTTWLSNPTLVYNTQLQKYVLGWYWAATILSTVGFGDILPENNIERFIVSLIEVCCCMSFGYFVNAIGQMIKMRSQSSQKYDNQVRSMNRLLNSLTLSNDLKHKIRTHYFNKHLVESMHDPKEEKKVFQTITPILKTSLLQQINLKIIKKCPQLQKFRSDTINHIAQSLKRMILAPQYIFYSRNSTDRKLWFIQNGTVEEWTDKFDNSKLRKTVSVYNEKEPLLGWINLVTSKSFKTLAKAKTFTVAHELDETQFFKCIRSDIRQYHKFLQIKQLMIEKKRQFNSKCISCGRYTHNVVNCPRIHFVKKDGMKIAQQRILLDKYILQQNSKKNSRPQIKYNWKKLFGTGKLEKQANILINNGNSKMMETGTVENFLKNLAFRESVMVFQKRKASFLIVNKDIKVDNQIKQMPKIIENYDKSRCSNEIEEEVVEIQFDKVFFNKQNLDYLPDNDIENVLNYYYKKVLKKKMNDQYKKTIPPFHN